MMIRKTEQKYRSVAWPGMSPIALLYLHKTFLNILGILSMYVGDYKKGIRSVL